jgi:predicted unusual protein kinase regulating ubiquinone biosynthesis (AarF/ABC1/UbiB family)
MLLPDGRFGIIDFGAVSEHPGGIPPEFGEVLCWARDEQWEQVIRLIKQLGFMPPEVQLSGDQVMDYIRPLWPYVDPLRSGEFHFTREWFQQAAVASTDLLDEGFTERFKLARQMTVPPGYVMLLRTLGGMIGVLVQLGAHVNYAAIAEEWMPGFFEPNAKTP